MPLLADLCSARDGMVTFFAAGWFAHSRRRKRRAPSERLSVRSRPACSLSVASIALPRTGWCSTLRVCGHAGWRAGAGRARGHRSPRRRDPTRRQLRRGVGRTTTEGPMSTSGLKALTNLGNIRVVAVLALVLVIVELVRRRGRWPFLFLLTVLVGMEISMLAVKDLVGRLRPTLNPAAASLGPSIPSGHSADRRCVLRRGGARDRTWAARPRPARDRRDRGRRGCSGRGEPRAARPALALRCRGGLALGWAWFALTAVVFGSVAHADRRGGHRGR